MLESLHVKNIALIDETEVTFTKGLNILSGETGAGKSLIIGSIQLALGGKADKSLIRNGAEYALVELVFSVTEEHAGRLKQFEIYPEDGMLSIQRRIMPTKSVCRINGEMVGGQTLREAAGILLDMHDQHDNQSLLKKQKHFEILNDYCGEAIREPIEEMKLHYGRMSELQKEWEETESLEANKEKEIALAEFEVKEIEEAGIVPDEDVTLEQSYRRMNNARKIGEAVRNAQTCIGGLDLENAYTMTDRALKELNDAMEYDDSFQEMADNLQTARELLGDVSHSLLRYMDSMEFSEAEYVETEARLNLLNHLKSKYGATLEEVLEYQKKQQDMLQKLSDMAEYRKKLKDEIEKERRFLLKNAKITSDIRKEQALILQDQMKLALQDLNFLDAVFEIRITTDEEKVNASGYDDVEFMISMNPGEAPRPLEAVASGGELSRIMLALKTVFAGQDHVETLVFDEIDAGISGKTAWKVSEKLAFLGKEHQIICITHLPQIAAMADTHFLIQKSVKDQVTTTELLPLSKEEMIHEIARLLGSDTVTEAVLNNAVELKKMADETKQY